MDLYPCVLCVLFAHSIAQDFCKRISHGYGQPRVLSLFDCVVRRVQKHKNQAQPRHQRHIVGDSWGVSHSRQQLRASVFVAGSAENRGSFQDERLLVEGDTFCARRVYHLHGDRVGETAFVQVFRQVCKIQYFRQKQGEIFELKPRRVSFVFGFSHNIIYFYHILYFATSAARKIHIVYF